MKYPCLVLKRFCKTSVEITLYAEDIGEDGAPLKVFENGEFYPSDSLYPSEILFGGCLLCNYQDKAKTVITADKQLVNLTAQAYFVGDIAPDLPNIGGGKLTVNGVTRRIYQGEKARNPDGTVNYTRLDLV